MDPAQETSSSNRFDVEKVTVVVSSTLNFPEYPDIERWNRERVRLGNGEERKERKWVVTVRLSDKGRASELACGGWMKLTLDPGA